MADDLVLTPAEVARLLRVSEVTVRRLVTRGELPRIAGIRVVLIPRTAVDRLLEGEYHVASDGSREGPGDGTVRDHPAERGETLACGRDDLAAERLGTAIGGAG